METASTDGGWLDYPRRLWQLRYFCLSLVQKDLRARYRNSSLGIGWSLVRPTIMTAVFCVVFSTVFNVSIVGYVPFLLTGLTVWQFFVECATVGCNTYVQSAAYIKQQAVPLAIFPLRTTLGAGVHGLIAFGVGLVFTACLRGFDSVPALLHLIPALLICFGLGWSIAILCGVANSHYADVQHILELAVQVFFYMTPVLYPPESLKSRPWMQSLLNWNPMTHVLELFRAPVLQGQAPPLESYAGALAFLLVLSGMACLALRRLERTLVFWI
jgi:lipopolysaccharide transport system permease protein